MKPIPDTTLRAVYTREQPYRRHWPADYETGMKNDAIAAIVRTLALHVPTWGRRHADRARIAWRQDGLEAADLCRCPLGTCDGLTVQQPAGVTCRQGHSKGMLAGEVHPVLPRAPAPKRHPTLDFKSRAAGEREESDTEPGTLPDH